MSITIVWVSNDNDKVNKNLIIIIENNFFSIPNKHEIIQIRAVPNYATLPGNTIYLISFLPIKNTKEKYEYNGILSNKK